MTPPEFRWVLVEFHDEEKAQDFMCNYNEFDHYRKTVVDAKEVELILLRDLAHAVSIFTHVSRSTEED